MPAASSARRGAFESTKLGGSPWLENPVTSRREKSASRLIYPAHLPTRHHWAGRTDIVGAWLAGWRCSGVGWYPSPGSSLALVLFHLPAFLLAYPKRRPTSHPTSAIGWRCRCQDRCFFLPPPSLFHQLGLAGGRAGWARNGGMSQDASCPALRREHHHANERLGSAGTAAGPAEVCARP